MATKTLHEIDAAVEASLRPKFRLSDLFVDYGTGKSYSAIIFPHQTITHERLRELYHEYVRQVLATAPDLVPPPRIELT